MRTHPRHGFRHLVAVGAIALVAACGGSDDASESSVPVDTEAATDEAGGEDEPVATTEGTDAASDDGADSDNQAFCEQVRMLDETSDNDLGTVSELYDELIASAPDEVRDDLQVVADAFVELEGVDEDDPDSFAVILEVFSRPEIVEASENLERFGVEECGLVSDDGSDLEIDAGEDSDDSIDDDAAEDTGDTADTDDADDDDPYDEEFWGPIIDGELSIPGLKQHLDVNHAESGWFDIVNGYTVEGESVVGVNGPLGPDDGVPLCEAILEYAGPLSPEVTITVEDDAGVVLASGNPTDGCSAA